MVSSHGIMFRNTVEFLFLVKNIYQSISFFLFNLKNFYFRYIEDLVKNENNCDSGSQLKTLEGILNAFQSIVGEIPAFFLSGWIIQKIGHNCDDISAIIN